MSSTQAPEKLLVFAHTPPPFHGQSYMVELAINGFGGDWRKRLRQKKTNSQVGDAFGIQCFHVNLRLSNDLRDVGGIRVGKIVRLIKYCVEAIWCRFRYGIDTLYYIPAPAKRSAIVRDWVVMLCVRPWFKRTVLHWHAFGLGEWVAKETRKKHIPQRCTQWLLKNVDMAIVLTAFNKADAGVFSPKQVVVVPNGIPDPCPVFEAEVLPERQDRWRMRQAGMLPLRVLFLAHCTREKGLFDTLEAIRLANLQLRLKGKPKMYLTVAGGFMNPEEKKEFEHHVEQIHQELKFDVVKYVGFLSGEAKTKVLMENDVLCFPTFYSGEALPVNLIEAMAFGLPMVTTKWRGIPEVIQNHDAFLIKVGDTAELAIKLMQIAEMDAFSEIREHFLENYTVERYLKGIEKQIKESAF